MKTCYAVVGHLAVAGLALATTAFGQAQSVPPSPSFAPIGEYQLEIDGVVDVSARIYHSAGRGTILVRTTRLSAGAVELQPRGQSFFNYAAGSLLDNGDGTFDVKVSAQVSGRGTFELIDNLPVFSVDGKRVRFGEKPPLLGPQDSKSLRAQSPAYTERAKAHEPYAEHVARLRSYPQPVHVKFFFGTWCSVCSNLMPRILKVEDVLSGSKFTFDYYGVPRDFKDPEVARLGVKSLPSGIIYVDGQEVGRVEGWGWNFPELALANALR